MRNEDNKIIYSSESIVQSNSAEVKEAFSQLLSSKNKDKIRMFCNTLISTRPDWSITWIIASEYAHKIGNKQTALECAARAVEITPTSCECVVQLAKSYLVLGDYNSAHKTSITAKELGPKTVKEMDTLGNIFSRCNHQESALEMFSKAAALKPNNPDILYNLATSYRFLGYNTKANSTFSKVIRIRPKDYHAVLARSILTKMSDSKNNLSELKENIDNIRMDQECKTHYLYAIAKELEDLGCYKESFENLKKGASIKTSIVENSLESNLNDIRAIKGIFEHKYSISGGHEFSSSPIFVMGLPRTGTTLTERVISSHSKIASAGELTIFPNELKRSISELSGKKSNKYSIYSNTLEIDFKSLGGRYLSAAKSRSKSESLFVDKLPFNFINMGYIRKAIPNAKMVLVRRNPMDSVYSMYKNLFNSGYTFSYNIQSIATYYVEFHKLVGFWSKRIPSSFIIVNYEDLVREPKNEIEKILKYIEVEWEDACINFHKNKQASTTASASQIRNPFYSSSIGMWKNYEEELYDARKIFDENYISY